MFLVLIGAIDIRGDIGPAEALYMAEIPKPVPKEGHALIRVKAFGINRADIMQRDGEYPVPPWAGKILGLEFSGIIEELGENSESSFSVGDEVFALAYGGKIALSRTRCENAFVKRLTFFRSLR
jgi:NADPH:quinone reductase-like Zn-dependent oxidoreductase